MEEEKKEVEVVVNEPTYEVDLINEKDEEITRLKEERDNYKQVALKRLGKLPNDSEFLGENGNDINELIEEKVKIALIDKEISRKEQEKEIKLRQLAKENSELRLALRNRPDGSIGGDSGSSKEVKDSVFSQEQLRALEIKALRLKADPQEFIEKAKKNFLNHR